jgi:hypothetical protein
MEEKFVDERRTERGERRGIYTATLLNSEALIVYIVVQFESSHFSTLIVICLLKDHEGYGTFQWHL